MIGDPLIISENDFKKANDIFFKIKEKDIILIGGTSGTHKTELAYCLQKTAFDNKETSLVISLDDYYHTAPFIRNYNRKKQGIESIGISEIDWDYLCRIYDDFANDKPIQFKRTHRFLDAIEHNVIDSESIKIIIFEGLYANYLRKFYSNNYSVFLEGNPVQTLEFRKLRGKENETDEFRKKVVQKEFNTVSQLKKYVDLIIPFEEEP